MTYTDRYGLPLTTASESAADCYNASLDAVLAFDGGVLEAVDQALAADPEFAMGHIHRARALQVEGRMSEAIASREKAQSLASGVSPREQEHIAILSLAIDGNGKAALGAIKDHLKEYPRNAFLLAQAVGPFGLIAFGGYQDRHEQNLALLESVRDDYGDDWWYTSSLAFALNELNRFDEAAPLAQRAYETRKTGNAAHTVAHVHFETGGVDAGVTFLEAFLSWHSREAQIHSHLGWHLALFELARNNPAGANRIMDDLLRPSISHGSPLSTLADGAALVWRQQLLGVEPAENAATDVAVFASERFSRPGVTFADLHCALVYGATGNFAALEELAAQMRQRLAEGKIPAGEVVPAVVQAITAFAREDYAAAIALLEPVANQVVKVGGSNAQREVFEDTLLEAYIRAGRSEPALELLDRRLARRPSSLDSARKRRAASMAIA